MNINIFVLSLAFLGSRYLFKEIPGLHPAQLLCVRGVICQVLGVFWANKKLKVMVWDIIPKSSMCTLMLRTL